MDKELSEVLAELHKKGWSDARVAVWIGDQMRAGFYGHMTGMGGLSIGPSSQSVYRWRRGTGKPHSEMYQAMIYKLHKEIFDEHQINHD